LEQMQVFKELILVGYLGQLPSLEAQLVDAISRDEDITEIKREYQEILRFKKYIDFLKQGEKSEFYQQMFVKANDSGLTSEDAELIRRSK